ncbi:TRAP transporter large permease [Zobellella denitrificans]|jgi:tripartite ATP-independent transporter DctM subunit|uniref:TRAP transporter large permease protein n=1 Tax=Zobellella denitrificans TaxID=347534 RepID=A0A291HLF6_9GAMM|nr:TRAP transporter large permease [Zobellella denitrificans]ATG72938.1 C4-dicarboxylate ABC transporter permease [Zobellella denitrificans]
MTTLAIITFLILALLGMPLAFALGLAALGGLAYSGIELSVMPQRMMHAVNSFPLMAIPLFMLAGELMVGGQVMQRTIDFANAFVGRVKGGLAHVTLLSGLGLASVTGAAVAGASALGTTMMPAMKKHYDAGFGSAVVASASNLGPIIPPSAAMIVYALMAGSSVSVGGLFMAGVVPGILLVVGMMALSSWIAHRKGYAPTGEPFSLQNLLLQTRRAGAIMLMPVVVIGGIVGGVFTATEGAAIAVIYAFVIGKWVTRKLAWADLPGCMFRAALTSAVVGALIAFATPLTFLFTIDLIPLRLSAFIQALTDNPHLFLALVMAMLLVVGMFLESNAAYIMLVPLFAPIALAYGIDPLYFGFLFVFNLVIGMMTPPVGVLLFVMCGIAKIPMSQLLRYVWPFIALQYLVLVLCWIFPGIVTALPRALGY